MNNQPVPLKQSHTKTYLDEFNTNPPLIPQSEVIAKRLREAGHRFFANDNIASFIKEGEMSALIKEATVSFVGVLKSLVIDIDNDPNSEDTAYRLAKMYFTEILAGRYEQAPSATAFPNSGEEGYKGMLVVRSEIKSICSHHHQPVTGVAYIGIVPREKLIGLSKYTRIAQHCSRRGTLQEELCNDIANRIIEVTGSEDVAVHIGANHGCCTNRGIAVQNSLTQTTVLNGLFSREPGAKKEFFDNIALQRQGGSSY